MGNENIEFIYIYLIFTLMFHILSKNQDSLFLLNLCVIFVLLFQTRGGVRVQRSGFASCPEADDGQQGCGEKEANSDTPESPDTARGAAMITYLNLLPFLHFQL